MNKEYDIIIGGGGHAGVEAAHIAAKLGMKVLLVTQNVDNIAQMSCNPAIGGLAKSHLVKELDILGGLMGLAADRTAIQFKTLNLSKGPAVWALRVQSDKRKYSSFIRQKLEKNKNIDIIQDEIIDLKIEDNSVTGVVTEFNQTVHAKAVILCSGTFLNATIHIGTKQIASGRLGERASKKLSNKMNALGFERGRLKTGTPPRISSDSINFKNLEIHGSDKEIIPFSFRSKGAYLKQVPCYLTNTNAKTHKIIGDNLGKTALFSGQITGKGPRYCPSIEDKIHRFADKMSHHLFLEPEGLETNEYYINGFSSSLPLEIQKEALHTIEGLEKGHFVRPAYAIEYDYFPSHQIKSSLETKKVENLYFAGQINGTSGYEEAAVQGFMASVNAVLKIEEKPPFILGRDEAYIGVLIDDLITKEITEPYRMFTSLAEYRLQLRHDNADKRLLSYSEKYHFLSKKEITFLNDRLQHIEEAKEIFMQKKIKLKEFNEFLSAENRELSREGTKLENLIKRADMSVNDVLNSPFVDTKHTHYEQKQAVIEIKYAGYIKRQIDLIKRFKKNENTILPSNFDYTKLKGLKKEATEKLNKIRPHSVGQATRIAGISPADISVILIGLKKLGII